MYDGEIHIVLLSLLLMLLLLLFQLMCLCMKFSVVVRNNVSWGTWDWAVYTAMTKLIMIGVGATPAVFVFTSMCELAVVVLHAATLDFNLYPAFAIVTSEVFCILIGKIHDVVGVVGVVGVIGVSSHVTGASDHLFLPS